MSSAEGTQAIVKPSKKCYKTQKYNCNSRVCVELTNVACNSGETKGEKKCYTSSKCNTIADCVALTNSKCRTEEDIVNDLFEKSKKDYAILSKFKTVVVPFTDIQKTFNNINEIYKSDKKINIKKAKIEKYVGILEKYVNKDMISIMSEAVKLLSDIEHTYKEGKERAPVSQQQHLQANYAFVKKAFNIFVNMILIADIKKLRQILNELTLIYNNPGVKPEEKDQLQKMKELFTNYEETVKKAAIEAAEKEIKSLGDETKTIAEKITEIQNKIKDIENNMKENVNRNIYYKAQKTFLKEKLDELVPKGGKPKTSKYLNNKKHATKKGRRTKNNTTRL